MGKPCWTEKGNYLFLCKGCGDQHIVYVRSKSPDGKLWGFDGDIENPTFHPSILLQTVHHGEIHICHFFISEGKVQYLKDCTHVLKESIQEL